MYQTVRHSLNGHWKLSFTLPDDSGEIHTEVDIPCNVEPVLVKLGLIDDYMPADYEYATARFETVDDWCYSIEFDSDNSNNWKQYLVFEGIDTIAEIFLNEEKICDCCNMHLQYRIDVTGKLKAKNNQLKVIIRSSELWARNHCHDMFSVAAHSDTSYYDSQTYLRKARHQWGWDNAPRLITSGIFRNVYLEEQAPEGFEEVYLYTESIDTSVVRLGADWIYRTDKKYLLNRKVRLTLLDNDKIVFEDTKDVRFIQGTIKYRIPTSEIKLWWPRGFGEAFLYTVRLEMLENDAVLAVYEAPFGIRTLKLDKTDDVLDDGTGAFVFRVNGEKIFIRGTNWKPLDPLGSMADVKTREGRALQEILNMNCNMVRIWGGGIYEDEYLYHFCDRHGLMVWQDFMLACEIPPIDYAYGKLIEEEAIQVIRRYRNHPCLAVWCGDNENDIAMTWIRVHAEMVPSDIMITRDILKRAVARFDPYRSYVCSSPFASDDNFRQRTTGVTHHQPETHLYVKSRFYAEELRNLRSYFIGETGPHQVNPIAVNKSIYAREQSRAERLWDAPKLLSTVAHQNDGYFTVWRNEGKSVCLEYYGRDFTFAEWKDYTLAINLLCAEIYKDAIEYSRATRWKKTGVIWWSLVDMWPMLFNYSVIDCDYNRKLPYYWIRQSQQEFAIMGVRTELNGELVLYAANDTLSDCTVEYTVTAYDEYGKGKVVAGGRCKQSKNSTSMIQRIAENDTPELWVIQWVLDEEVHTNHVFTKKTSYDVMKMWVKIIAEQSGTEGEILELQ